mmetsp:Transcript_9439/g.27091  ORF Transcript_9439/g.27091 Transcript_9439/m.27091 type:complete len:204 (+) Transcript_9439:188-799(+)
MARPAKLCIRLSVQSLLTKVTLIRMEYIKLISTLSARTTCGIGWSSSWCRDSTRSPTTMALGARPWTPGISTRSSCKTSWGAASAFFSEGSRRPRASPGMTGGTSRRTATATSGCGRPTRRPSWDPMALRSTTSRRSPGRWAGSCRPSSATRRRRRWTSRPCAPTTGSTAGPTSRGSTSCSTTATSRSCSWCSCSPPSRPRAA